MQHEDIVRHLFGGGNVPTAEVNKRLDIVCRALQERQCKGLPQIIVMNYGETPLQGERAFDHHLKIMVARMKWHITELDVPAIADIMEIRILLVYREQHKVINFQDVRSRLPGNCHQIAQEGWQMACGL